VSWGCNVANVELYFNGSLIADWTQLEIKHSIDQLCATWAAKFPSGVLNLSDLMNTQLVTIMIDGEVEFMGYLEKYNHTGSASGASMEMTGRNVICDLVDSSITDELKTELAEIDSTDFASAKEYLLHIAELVLDNIYPTVEQFVGFNNSGAETVKPGQPQIIDLIDVDVAPSLDEELNIETATRGYRIINNIANKLGVAVTSDNVGNLIFYRPKPVNKSYTPKNINTLRVSKDYATDVLESAVNYDSTDCYYTYKLVGEDGEMYETFISGDPIYATNNYSVDNVVLSNGAIVGFTDKTIKNPIYEVDKRFRPTRYTEIKIDSGLDSINLRTYLNDEISRRVSDSWKYTASVAGMGYPCRDYVRIQDDLLKFNGLFLVQSRVISIKDDSIKTSMVCVSPNTYTSESAASVLSSATITVDLPKMVTRMGTAEALQSAADVDERRLNVPNTVTINGREVELTTTFEALTTPWVERKPNSIYPTQRDKTLDDYTEKVLKQKKERTNAEKREQWLLETQGLLPF